MHDHFLPQRDNLDKSITDLTEVVLLPFQSTKDVVHVFYRLAWLLNVRFSRDGQYVDIKSSLKYVRYLRDNFHSLEAFNIPRDDFASLLVGTLAQNLVLGSGDIIKDMEDIVALLPEVLVSDVSTNDSRHAIVAFANAVTRTEIFRRGHTQQVADRVIQMLREATVLKPDSHVSFALVSFALASCLAARFQTAHVINDYEEAMTIADTIVAAMSPGDTLTRMIRDNAIGIILELLASRWNAYAKPEYLEDSIHHLRALLCVPSLPNHHRTVIDVVLGNHERQLLKYLTGPGIHFKDSTDVLVVPVGEASRQWDGSDDDSGCQTPEKFELLHKILTTLRNDEITDVEVAVEHARTLLPPPHSILRFSCLPAIDFAQILKEAYIRTKNTDYLNEAIIAYRGLRKVPVQKEIHFVAGCGLFRSLLQEEGSPRMRDYEEAMQLAPMIANDGSGEIFLRFNIAFEWANAARCYGHPSTSTAYETAMSLMEEILVFSPTLQSQHLHLVEVFRESEGLPSDYASYQIMKNRHKQAVETLEQGRALLWSEMRGLRTSADQLHAADPAIADQFAAINRKLELVTMSVAQSEGEEIGGSEIGTRRREEMDSIGHLVVTQRRLLEERNSLISRIRSLPGFEDFLKPPSFDALNSAAAYGPVIIINQSKWFSDVIILLKDSPPSVIPVLLNCRASDFHRRANELKGRLLGVRMKNGLDSKDYDFTLTSVLADLYELIGKPIIERLRQLNVPEKSRVWWCPTSAFCSLPLHAMGPIPSDDSDNVYFMDLYISSYTPTLSALIESRKPGSQPKTLDKPSLLLVAQPKTLPGAWGEINVLEAVGSPVTTLVSEKATPTTVVASLRDHQFVHFVCHGLLETGKPFDASFDLHGDNLTLLDIVRSQLPAAEFAFLSACHTAELTEDSIADEGLHLAAAMQYCGFRSVIGTMWAMADTDGADLSKHFYRSIFSERTGQRGVPYYERSARALQFAVKKLREKRGITLERWVNFVHYGA